MKLEEEIYEIIKKECPKTAELLERQWGGAHLVYIKSELYRNPSKEILMNIAHKEARNYILASEIIDKRLMNNAHNYTISDERFMELRKEGRTFSTIAVAKT